MNDIISAIILGVVEGLTEFLPVSSTGHLIIVNEFVNFTGRFAEMFDIVIQLGAMLSVIVYFRHKLFPFGAIKNQSEKAEIIDIWKKIIVGVIPALILGALFGDIIQEHLFNPVTVAVALLAGGLFLIFIERRKSGGKIDSFVKLSYRTAFLIGVIQCLAMIPGTSRSAATIIGAMLLGTSRVIAAEFSFFLAVPTLFAASVYSLMKMGLNMSSHQIMLLAVGFAVSFAVAWMVIAGFMKFISKRDFAPFGYYRIILGTVVLIYFGLK